MLQFSLNIYSKLSENFYQFSFFTNLFVNVLEITLIVYNTMYVSRYSIVKIENCSDLRVLQGFSSSIGKYLLTKDQGQYKIKS